MSKEHYNNLHLTRNNGQIYNCYYSKIRSSLWHMQPTNATYGGCRLPLENTVSFCEEIWCRTQLQFVLKGVVHPKMKILSLFTHLPLVPNLCESLPSACLQHKQVHMCKNVGNQTVAIDLTITIKWKQMASINGLITVALSLVVFNSWKKFIQVWNKIRMGIWWQNFHFWIN